MKIEIEIPKEFECDYNDMIRKWNRRLYETSNKSSFEYIEQ